MFGNIFNNDNLSQNSSKTIEDVPVEILYNTKSLHVTKSTDTVDVTISGPQSKLLKIESSDDIKVTVDLSNAKAGNYKEDYIVKGLISNDISYNVKPKHAYITLEDKVTKTMHVQPDIAQNNINSNYKVSEASLDKDTVQVIGGEKQLDKIAYLKATFKNATNISENTSELAEIAAFDKQLNKLNVQIKPNNVKMSVKLEPYSKKVKIKTVKKGSLPDGENLDNIKLNENEVEIYGNKDDLKDINEVEAEVNLDDITESTDKTLQLKLPKQVKKSEFNKVTAHVNLN